MTEGTLRTVLDFTPRLTNEPRSRSFSVYVVQFDVTAALIKNASLFAMIQPVKNLANKFTVAPPRDPSGSLEGGYLLSPRTLEEEVPSPAGRLPRDNE